MQARLNVIVSGGSGSGKTTMLNTLSRFIPEDERIVTIEDTAELQIQQGHLGAPGNASHEHRGHGTITQRDLVINALRMRPDRIIIGECRGPEALDMLQAMNTGHDGSMTTCHANSGADAFSRLETMVMMATGSMPDKVVRNMLSSAIHIVVHMNRLTDGTRKIMSVSEVVGVDGGHVEVLNIFQFDREGVTEGGRVIGSFRATGYQPAILTRLKAYGIRVKPEIFEEVVEVRD